MCAFPSPVFLLLSVLPLVCLLTLIPTFKGVILLARSHGQDYLIGPQRATIILTGLPSILVFVLKSGGSQRCLSR